MQEIEIQPCGPVTATVQPPGSKSITNRALVCAALADGESKLIDILDSEDTRVMVDSLQKLGIHCVADWQGKSITVEGCNGKIPATDAELFVENSGTTIRFLTAMCALGNGTYRLDGIERMRQRPIGDLLAALEQLGVDCESNHDCPPVTLRTNGFQKNEVSIRGNISSQYLSGLLMAAPFAGDADFRISVDGELVSKPYVAMTTEVMRSFGAESTFNERQNCFEVPTANRYRGIEYPIEPDASAASYFWAMAAITNGSVTVSGLNFSALQGDVNFCKVLEKMGCQITESENAINVTGPETLNGIDIDMNAISDTVQTLAAVALFANGPTRVRGVAHNRHKETDRIGDLATELRKCGAEVNEHEDGLTIVPPIQIQSATFETYNDHRMAMSLALIGLRQPGIVITNPDCTKKTFPNYFEVLRELTASS